MSNSTLKTQHSTLRKAVVDMYPSGNKIDLLNPDPELIEIEDIAHCLSILPRWTGNSRFPYTVGQHSIWCYKNVIGPELGLQALMHDATEAYVNDLAAPLKKQLPRYQTIEGGIWWAIATKYDLPMNLDLRVKDVDVKALVLERQYLKSNKPGPFQYQHHTKTKKEFLDLFYRLTDPEYDKTKPALITCKVN